ncbi:MAG: tRNA (adenine(22)-N(1))-methyltransferase TrmK [Tenericutes bacterium]|nr:tRNA (adenine(22)-N(1))-methyltransferase TrmK [Mycoplasmatota bacterium]
MSISVRLQVAAKYVKGFHYLADCGTDHAYLPIYAIQNGLVEKAIASDNKIGPITNALANIKDAGLEDRIELLHASGLVYLNEEVDIASVLGMGGRLIADILEEANTSNLKRLVLGPNSETKILRQYLMEHHFNIIAEELVEEKKKFYQVIVCETGTMNLTELELEFGPIIIKDKSVEFKKYINKLINKLSKALTNIKSDSEAKTLEARIKSLEEVIS